jgi:NIMA (never in mitosis gene a)-related kinase
MKHIHDRKIIHRDLKGQNIFLTTKGIVQIGDFGIAKVLAATMAKAKTCVGTPYYLSPEIVQSQPYTLSTDVWSLGVVLYELCALKPPFDAPSLHLLSMKIVRGVFSPLPSNFSAGMKTLVQNCLNIVPGLRPSVNQILKLPLIQDRIKTYLSASVI